MFKNKPRFSKPDQAPAHDDPAPDMGNYRGKFDNWKGNPTRSTTANRDGGKTRSVSKPKPSRPPTDLPAPTRKSTLSPIDAPTRDEPIWKESIFSTDMGVREIDLRSHQTPSAVALVPLADIIYNQMIEDDSNLGKELTIETFRYYAVALLWLRIIELKVWSSIALTVAEERIRSLTSSTMFAIPEPLYLYLKGFGKIVDKLDTHLYPDFPPLPTIALAGYGGYYGVIGAANHMLYEEIPCLGVVAEGVRHSASNEAPGPYASLVALPNLVANSNLLGFGPLLYRRNEAKNMLLALGITLNDFPVSVPATGFNYGLLLAVSNVLATNKTFKIQLLNSMSYGETGSQAQVIVTRPTLELLDPHTQIIKSEVYAESLGRESLSSYGIATAFDYQLFKEPSPENIPAAPWDENRTWTPMNFTAANPPPAAWILNRNDRRLMLPPEFLIARFRALSQNSENYRARLVRLLVSENRH